MHSLSIKFALFKPACRPYEFSATFPNDQSSLAAVNSFLELSNVEKLFFFFFQEALAVEKAVFEVSRVVSAVFVQGSAVYGAVIIVGSFEML